MLCPWMLGAGGGAKTSEAGKVEVNPFLQSPEATQSCQDPEFTAVRLLSSRAGR